MLTCNANSSLASSAPTVAPGGASMLLLTDKLLLAASLLLCCLLQQRCSQQAVHEEASFFKLPHFPSCLALLLSALLVAVLSALRAVDWQGGSFCWSWLQSWFAP